MKIIIVNGKHEADYIVKHFNTRKNELIVINDNKEFAEYISYKNDVPVFYGDATKYYTLMDAEIKNADLLIALTDDDIENYVISKYAKEVFNVKKVICLVKNPKKVQIFKNLKIDTAISSIYLLTESIMQESSIESVFSTLTIKQDKLVLIDLIVEEDMFIANKLVKDAKLPININIGCILRDDDEVIIPYGETLLLPNDHLYIITEMSAEEEILKHITKRIK